MVSFWPWRESRSPTDEFEKTLSQLSEKIAHTQAALDVHRVRARRHRVIFSLYAGLAYLLVTVILVLVLGWRNWGTTEYTGVAGGPVAIYIIRRLLNAYYDFRIRKDTDHLRSLQKQSAETIDKLKEATKYNSTQKLLRKYAAAQNPTSADSEGRNTSSKKTGKKHRNSISVMQAQMPPQGRTGMPPPPTANIRRSGQEQRNSPPPQATTALPNNLNVPSTPNRPGSAPTMSLPSSPYNSPIPQQSPQSNPANQPSLLRQEQADFAPNAFPIASFPYEQQAQQYPASYPPYQTHWYDRLFDVLLGEDETNPKNRIVLLCAHCRTVNGQAPPGIKTLEELGRWKCGFCGAWNGVSKTSERSNDSNEKDEEKAAGNKRGHVRQRSQSHPVTPVSQENTEQRQAPGDGYPVTSTTSNGRGSDNGAVAPGSESLYRTDAKNAPMSSVSVSQGDLPEVSEEGSAISDEVADEEELEESLSDSDDYGDDDDAGEQEASTPMRAKAA